SMFFAAFMLWLFIRFVPDSPIGRRLFLKTSAKEWDGFETGNRTLLGKTGVSCTMLRPSGLAMIDDERIDVVTEGEMIQKDQRVKVIEIEGNRIVVAIDHGNDR
ncbi:MAG: NfeD family protein, partial [Lentisphaeria bacterium]|nr:NfeD family protein [Lentisphaeria bacterium]